MSPCQLDNVVTMVTNNNSIARTQHIQQDSPKNIPRNTRKEITTLRPIIGHQLMLVGEYILISLTG
jgi:hypothetical protein